MMKLKNVKFAFFNKKSPDEITLIRKVLYDFNYTNLSTNLDYDKLEINAIRKGILNFIYTGNFEEDDLTNLNSKLNEAIKNDCIDEISKRKKKLNNKKYQNTIYIPEKNNIISEISSYEAQLDSEFIFENSFYDNFESIADAILKNHKTFLSSLKKIDYILVYEAPPFKNKNADDYLNHNYFLTNNKGNYASSIKTCFNSQDDCIDLFINKNIAYFDLFMAGMPIGNIEVEVNGTNKSLRECWCTEQKWEIGGKALPVVLFELGIYHLLKEKTNSIIKFPKIAIGAPIKSSVSILEYYHEKPLKIFVEKNANPLTLDNVVFSPDKIDLNNYEEMLSIDVAQSNTSSTFKNIDSKGILVPLHKANIVSSANSPHSELMKNAFDILTTNI